MGSSLSAVHDMLKEEEHNRKVAEAKRILENMTPERLMVIVDSLNRDLGIVAKYGVGSESFWVHLRSAQETVKNLK